MNPLAIAGACAGGLAGALVWAAISHFTGYEVGYVAWGVGLVVGFGSLFLGGRGAANGILCAVVTVAAIFLGKGLAMSFVRDKAIEDANRQFYETLRADATAFSMLKSKTEYPDFMVRRDFVPPPKKPNEVTEEEVAEFSEKWAPLLERMQAEDMSFEVWQDTEVAQRESDQIKAAAPIIDLVKENLGAVDIIFMLLGIATAYKVGAGRGREEPTGAPEGGEGGGG